MATYAEMVMRVRDWANRSEEVLSFNNIVTFIDYALDNAYRSLRVVPLESTLAYAPVAEQPARSNRLSVPPDLIEIIQLRKLRSPYQEFMLETAYAEGTIVWEGDEGYFRAIADIPDTNETLPSLDVGTDGAVWVIYDITSRNDCDYWDIYESKRDIRSFNSTGFNVWDGAGYYTREGTNFYVYPELKQNDQIALYYYRRLPSPYARIGQDSLADIFASLQFQGFTRADNSNLTDGVNLYYGSSNNADDDFPNAFADIRAFVEAVATEELGTGASSNEITAFADLLEPAAHENSLAHTGFPPGYYLGKDFPHWIRDENEKVILFGALAEAFDYLDEPEQAGKYHARFQKEIQMLDAEEKMRHTSGGNLQVGYRSYLI